MMQLRLHRLYVSRCEPRNQSSARPLCSFQSSWLKPLVISILVMRSKSLKLKYTRGTILMAPWLRHLKRIAYDNWRRFWLDKLSEDQRTRGIDITSNHVSILRHFVIFQEIWLGIKKPFGAMERGTLVEILGIRWCTGILRSWCSCWCCCMDNLRICWYNLLGHQHNCEVVVELLEMYLHDLPRHQ